MLWHYSRFISFVKLSISQKEVGNFFCDKS